MNTVPPTQTEPRVDGRDHALLRSPQFLEALTRKITDLLDLKEDDTFVVLGCGAGGYSIEALSRVPLRNPVVAVDPDSNALASLPPHVSINSILEDALSFSELPITYDKILLNEAVQALEKRQTLFDNLFAHLGPEGRLLLVDGPRRVEDTGSKTAKERVREAHARLDELDDELREAGFATRRETLRYEFEIERNLAGGRARFRPALARVPPAEIDEALRGGMQPAGAGHGELAWNFDCIIGSTGPLPR